MRVQRFNSVLRGALVVCALLLVAAIPAQADPINLVSNGSFENPVVQGGGDFQPFTAGNSLGAWQIVSGSVDLLRGHFPAQEGLQAVDLSGDSAGSILQVLTTTAGQSYTLSFYASGNIDGPPVDKMLQVNIGGDTHFVTAPFSTAYNLFSFTFTATSASTVLQFSSLVETPFGPVIDNVSVTPNDPSAVPEPTTMLLLGTGLAGVAAGARRRRQARKDSAA